MSSPGKDCGETMNIDFYAIESIKQDQIRHQLTAEKRARIHEAFLDVPLRPGLRARLMASMRGVRTNRPEAVEPQFRPRTISTNASNGD